MVVDIASYHRCTERGQRRCTGLGAGERAHLATVGEQRAQQGAAHEAGAARQEDGPGHPAPGAAWSRPESTETNRARYCTADTIVITAASAMSH